MDTVTSLPDALHARREGLCLYGLTPPKRSQEAVRIREIAERQARRIRDLAPDGLIIYDLQDEAGRNGTERPFPFLPTLEPLEYARDFLDGLPLPKILYKCVANLDRAAFEAWTGSMAGPGRDACVLVGAPTSNPGSGNAGLGLREAYGLLRDRETPVCFGGVAIAERHARRNDEDERLLSKHQAGCRFFVSQTVFDPGATRSLLSDYALRFACAGLPPVPFILSFSPCGSLRTMEFMKWLGISFPRWLENELRHSPDILEKSVDLAVEIFEDVAGFAAGKGIPIGVNVESVSIRKEEIEASGALFERIATRMRRGNRA
jgi:hypothetical protein